ncbi:unnamed protein product [Diabrotica balteata]|uniref:Uncharacterized protein n=1 Tax=Diabrotica balteata TaxID=107213 RepID=A0A9N9SU06_DIABA|nr:unnamed protein product [Diabrotica balteata]
MEIKQEASEETCKIKTENEACDESLDAFKIEIKEEPNTENAYDSFDYLDSNVFSVNTKVEQDEHKLTLFEGKKTTNEEGK